MPKQLQPQTVRCERVGTRKQNGAHGDMLAGFLNRLRTFPRDTRAATAVEFALLVTPLITLILASLQCFMIFYAGQVLQSAATSSGRLIMTGQAQTTGDTQAQYQTAVCNNAPILFTCSNIMVDVESATAYSSISTTPLTVTYNGSGAVTNTWSYSPGNPGDIVILRVMYNWPVVGGPLTLGLADQSNGDHLLVATSVFKNEPY
jgi:Flp pilus assembly protein TadG